MKVRYLSVSEIAKQKWCEQKAIFETKRNQSEIKYKYLELKSYQDQQEKKFKKLSPKKQKQELKEKWESERLDRRRDEKPKRKLFISREKIERYNMFQFLRTCRCTIKLGIHIGALPLEEFGTFSLVARNINVTKKEKEIILDYFEESYLKWKNSFFNSSAIGVFIDPYRCGLPWRNYHADLVYNHTPTLNGTYLEKRYARLYYTNKEYFKWKKCIIVARPDGLTKAFAYEFKGCKNEYFASFQKHVGLQQANLYAYLFNRPKYRFDLLIESKNEIEAYYEKTDKKGAEELLERMESLLEGKVQPTPPAKFKCKLCEFASKCKIKK